MPKKWGYIARLEAAVTRSHGCGAIWHKTVPVHEVLRGQTVWKGDVEVFNLKGHPNAGRCYGWSQRNGKKVEGEHFVTVLEIPPVESASMAVRVTIATDWKMANEEHE